MNLRSLDHYVTFHNYLVAFKYLLGFAPRWSPPWSYCRRKSYVWVWHRCIIDLLTAREKKYPYLPLLSFQGSPFQVASVSWSFHLAFEYLHGLGYLLHSTRCFHTLHTPLTLSSLSQKSVPDSAHKEIHRWWSMKIREVRPQSGDMKPVGLGHLEVILVSDETSSQLAVILKVFTVCVQLTGNR